jgi:hypothetical protein
MKIMFTAAFLFAVACNNYPQSNNMDYELWDGLNPTGWFTSNIQGYYIPVTQSTDAHGGSYAVKGTVIEITGGTTYTALLSAGPLAKGLPVSSRAEAVTGWYKFASDSNDFFSVTIGALKNGQFIGSGFYYSYNIEPAYKQFSVNVIYNSNETPDTLQVVILIAADGGQTHPGSTFYVDDISFGTSTAVNEEHNGGLTYELEQNYPNPFNPATSIKYSIKEPGNVQLIIYDALGREVAELVNRELSAGRYTENFNAGGLSSGVYYCRIMSGGFVQTKPMLLLK